MLLVRLVGKTDGYEMAVDSLMRINRIDGLKIAAINTASTCARKNLTFIFS